MLSGYLRATGRCTRTKHELIHIPSCNTRDPLDLKSVPCFQAEQQCQCLHAIVAAINEIAHEDIARVRHLPPTSEQPEQVKELAVDVAAYCDGAPHGLHVALLNEDLLHLMVMVKGRRSCLQRLGE